MSCCNAQQINLHALALLADTDLAKEANVSSKLPENLKAAMKRRLEQRETDRAEQAADSILAIIDAADNAKIEHVKAIRAARATIEASQRALKQLDSAIEYGHASSNYIPLAALIIPPSVLNASGVPYDKMVMLQAANTASTKPSKKK